MVDETYYFFNAIAFEFHSQEEFDQIGEVFNNKNAYKDKRFPGICSFYFKGCKGQTYSCESKIRGEKVGMKKIITQL